jgi:TatD DNase family protein
MRASERQRVGDRARPPWPGNAVDGWVDSHCHLPDGDADELVAEAVAAGVGTMVTVGCDRASSIEGLAIAGRHPGVHATVGLHPHEARFGVATILDLLDGPVRPVAVGECGLDYHYDHSPRDAQREAFAAQVALANERRLPLVIHTREAWDDTFDVLDANGVPARTIFHCFTGGPAEVIRCLDRGGYVSFSGIVTFNGAPEVREAAALVPLGRTLVETDSPYLAPVPHRGKRNRPAWVPYVGARLAEVHGVGVDEVRDASRAAAHAAFAFGDASS